MYRERTPGTGATLTFPARTRGGGDQNLTFLLRTIIPSVSGAGDVGVSIDIAGAVGGGVAISVSDQGVVGVDRYASDGITVSSSSGSGLVVSPEGLTRPIDIYVSVPKAMLAGTQATVYHNGAADGSWAALSMSGATSPGGTANDLNGAMVLTLGDTSAGNWRVSRVMGWQGALSPTRNQCFDIAAGLTDPTSFLGMFANARLEANLVDERAGVAGTNVGGTVGGGRRKRFLIGSR